MARSLPLVLGAALLSLATPVAVTMASGRAVAEAPVAAAPVRPGPVCVADFERFVQPLFNLRCVQCHQNVTGGGGLSLQAAGTADRIVLAPSTGSALNLVQPGRPDESYLYLKVTGRQAEANGMGARMPLIGARLSDEEIGVIRAWIEGCTVVSGQG